MSKLRRELSILLILGVSLVLGSLCVDFVGSPNQQRPDVDMGQLPPVEAVASLRSVETP